MKDIIEIQIQLLPERFPAVPWFAKIYSRTYDKQKRFFSLHDVLMWLIKEEEEK
jgi:hypothetical protein